MKKYLLSCYRLIATAGLVLIMTGFPASTQEKNLVGIGGGMASPSNGSGWITDHLEAGLSAYAEYCRQGEGRLLYCIDARLLDHDVDTSGTTEEGESVKTSTYGLGAGLRYRFVSEEKYDLFMGAGPGFYTSELRAGSATEDTSNGAGLDLNLGASVKLKPGFFMGARVDYIMLFLGEGAGFDDLSFMAGLGFVF